MAEARYVTSYFSPPHHDPSPMNKSENGPFFGGVFNTRPSFSKQL